MKFDDPEFEYMLKEMWMNNIESFEQEKKKNSQTISNKHRK